MVMTRLFVVAMLYWRFISLVVVSTRQLDGNGSAVEPNGSSLDANGDEGNALRFLVWAWHPFQDNEVYDFLVRVAIIALVITATVYFCGWLIGRGAPTEDADDEDDCDEYDELTHIPPEVYARFSARKRRWFFLRMSHCDPYAYAWCLYLDLMSVLALTSMIADSLHYVKTNYEMTVYILEWSFLVTFGGEALASALSAKDTHAHFSDPFTWLDVCSAIPSLTDITLDDRLLYWTKLFRMTRIARVSRLLRESRLMRAVLKGFGTSMPIFIFSLNVIALIAFIFGALMFYAENATWDEDLNCFRRYKADEGHMEEGCSPIVNMGDAFYFAVTTVTSVGYGDIVPVTRPGKILFSIMTLVCMIITAFPIAMIVTTFSVAFEALREEERQNAELKKASFRASLQNEKEKTPQGGREADEAEMKKATLRSSLQSEQQEKTSQDGREADEVKAEMKKASSRTSFQSEQQGGAPGGEREVDETEAY